MTNGCQSHKQNVATDSGPKQQTPTTTAAAASSSSSNRDKNSNCNCNKKWQTQQGSKHSQHEQLIFHINDINTTSRIGIGIGSRSGRRCSCCCRCCRCSCNCRCRCSSYQQQLLLTTRMDNKSDSADSAVCGRDDAIAIAIAITTTAPKRRLTIPPFPTPPATPLPLLRSPSSFCWRSKYIKCDRSPMSGAVVAVFILCNAAVRNKAAECDLHDDLGIPCK